MADIQKKGAKLDSYGGITIFHDSPYFLYTVDPVVFSAQETELKSVLISCILKKQNIDDVRTISGKAVPKVFITGFKESVMKPLLAQISQESLLSAETYASVSKSLFDLVKKNFLYIAKPKELVDSALADSVGYGPIDPLIKDGHLEEIMVNGYASNVFVFHSKYGHCKTNITFPSRKDLDFLLQRIALTVGREFNGNSPLLDARLPDGNRANATYQHLAPTGPSLTIRKFSSVPISVIALIKNNTFTSELAAFIWLFVEGMGFEPMNLIVTGGSGSGKTTTLNAISSFIRMHERIVSIEDTLELQLADRENWIQLEARPDIKGETGVSMDDLLKNSMRMRPDRILVGEVRGKEAQTMFTAMDTGHKGLMGTLHSNSAKETLLRLKSEPMSVPESMIPLLNLILVQYRVNIEGEGVKRRVLSLTEVTSLEGKPLLSNIFEWNNTSESIKRTDTPMHLLDVLSRKTLKSKKDIEKEVYIRKKILEWMVNHDLVLQKDVESVLQQYYYFPEELLQKVLSDSIP